MTSWIVPSELSTNDSSRVELDSSPLLEKYSVMGVKSPSGSLANRKKIGNWGMEFSNMGMGTGEGGTAGGLSLRFSTLTAMVAGCRLLRKPSEAWTVIV